MGQRQTTQSLAIGYRLSGRTQRRLGRLLKPAGVRLLYATRPAQVRRLAEEAPIVFVEPTADDQGATRSIRSIQRQSIHHHLFLVTRHMLPDELAESMIRKGVHGYVGLSEDPEVVGRRVRFAAARHHWSAAVAQAAADRIHRGEGVRMAEVTKKLAHDLANLHQVISVELETAEIDAAAPLPEGLQDALTASQAMKEIISKLGALGGGWQKRPVLTDVSTRLDHLRRLMRGAVPESVEVTVECKVEGRILAQPGDLDQLVLNLAKNAGEAMPGGGHLSLKIDRVRLREGPGESTPVKPFVRLTVSDTGPGIPRELSESVFERGVSGSGEIGRGLGLNIVRGILDRLDGRAFVSSELGEGTTFQLLIPEVARRPVHRRGANPTATPATSGDPRSTSVLPATGTDGRTNSG